MAEGTRRIEIGALARVEGEGALHVRVEGDRVEDVRLEIYEPPRFFEALLRGRPYTDAPDITSRICGICPIAYQVSAIAAMEDALGVEVPEEVRLLRRLIYCGEWLESHALHAFMLHAPDFLGYEGAIEMARAEHPEPVERGLRIKRAGNDVLTVIGGRAVHPVNLRVGGFYRVPSRAELAPLRETLERAREDLAEAVAWTGTLEFPDHELDYEMVSLRTGDAYPIESGRLVSDRGLDIGPREFTEHFEEEQIEHSTALHARIRERGNYLVGPLARYNLNSELLPPDVRAAASAAGLGHDLPQPVPEHHRPLRRDALRRRRGDPADRRLRALRAPGGRDRAARGDRKRLVGGPAGSLLAPLHARRGRHDPAGHDRPADVAEPGFDRAGSEVVRGREPGPRRRAAAAALRAGGPQLRPVHLLLDSLPPPRDRAPLSMGRTLVVGLGNRMRGDDAVGLEVAATLAAARPDLDVRGHEREPIDLIELWTGASRGDRRRRGRRRGAGAGPPARRPRPRARLGAARAGLEPRDAPRPGDRTGGLARPPPGAARR